MTETAPAQESSDTYDTVVGRMRAHGAQDDRDAHEAARNLIGFAQLALSIRRRRQQERLRQ